MFIGPVFFREALLAPRRARMYLSRVAYGGLFFLLMATAWLLLTGTQIIQSVGETARFAGILFQIIAPLQLAIMMASSALLAASTVSQEKDRRTFVLLLITNLTNSELVLGKLLASLLEVLMLLLASLPVFMLTALLGGVSFEQILRIMLVTLLSSLVAGSLGSTIALWRDSTFQAIAYTALGLVAWMLGGEVFAQWTAGHASWAPWSASVSPIRAVLAAAQPLVTSGNGALHTGHNFLGFILLTSGAILLLNGLAILLVRDWNPTRQVRASTTAAEAGTWETSAGQTEDAARAAAHAAPGAVRHVWNNPVLWREIRTWAYGRKALFIRVAYLAICGLIAWNLLGAAAKPTGITRAVATAALAPLMVVSLILINAQAVTSLTTERDLGALDLLLVTDLTAKEFVFGKLLGAVYNVKEIVLTPLLMCGYLWWIKGISGENFVYLTVGWLVLAAFAVMLGVHAGMTYLQSRAAIGASLGTIFFLCLGVATCMRMMIAFSGSFHFQLAPFFVLSVGGGVGLYLSLGHRNPSTAIGLASFACPSATFYAITSYLQDGNLSVLLVTVLTYGFAIAAMLIPAIYEFDLATGRTTLGDT